MNVPASRNTVPDEYCGLMAFGPGELIRGGSSCADLECCKVSKETDHHGSVYPSCYTCLGVYAAFITVMGNMDGV